MPDQSPDESGPNQQKEKFWTRFLKRKKVNNSNNVNPIDKVLEEKPKAEPDSLKILQNWWLRQEYHYRQGDQKIFSPWNNSVAFFTSDSNFPSYVNDNRLQFLREKKLIPFSNPSKTLPLDSDKVRRVLPPYLKLSPIDIDETHRVYIVNPSSKILELTAYKEGKFLFRGESADSPDNSADLIVNRLKEGVIKHKNGSEIHTTPELLVAARTYAYGSIANGVVWIIDREAMNEHPISIQNAGIEVLFPRISFKHVVGCITSPEVEKAVKDRINLPAGFLHVMPFPVRSSSLESHLDNLTQMDNEITDYIKGLEQNRH